MELVKVVGEESTDGSLKWSCPQCKWDNFNWPGVGICTTCDTEVQVVDPMEIDNG